MNLKLLPLLAAAVAATGALGCGADAGAGYDDDLAPPYLGADILTQRAYLGVTNRVSLASMQGTSVNVDLVAGAKVQLEVAAVDGQELTFKILHTRADGSTELVNPVRSASGFKLTTLEATSGGTFSLAFPKGNGGREVVVWMECASEGAHCALNLQPGEACFLGVSCDEGLACLSARGECDPVRENGVCVARERAECKETPVSR